MRGLKTCIVGGAGPNARAAACKLLAALCNSAAPAVLLQLIEADTCEYLFECLRATRDAGGEPDVVSNRMQPGKMRHASGIAASEVPSVLAALKCLSNEGGGDTDDKSL